MAQESGLFRKYGLSVSLSRELGWATVRDKIIHRELDAAHAVAGMPFAATLGLGSIARDCLTGLVLSQQGNAITLSTNLWRRVRDARSLHEEIVRLGRQKILTFGVVYSFSSHHFLLRSWLQSAGIDPDRDVRIVVVPPPQMPANLKAGHLDGFCVGEPWNSVAVESRTGHIVATSAELAARHPEKVLMVSREFAETRSEEHRALIAALLDACAFCARPENHKHVAGVLSHPKYVGVPVDVLLNGFTGRIKSGGNQIRSVPDFFIFDGEDAHEPSGDKAAWVIQQLRSWGTYKDHTALNGGLIRRVFRADIYDEAVRLQRSINRSQTYENKSQHQLTPA